MDLVDMAGAEVELKGGQKLTAKMVILADGVHSKTARKYHKMPLNHLQIGGWRYAHLSSTVALQLSNAF